jgi:uncharacterized protein (TIGR01244 family)
MARPLGEAVFVSGQILPEDVADLAARDVAIIVNNRPDDEEPGQPAGAEIETAARAAGLDYVHIPISDGFSDAKIAAMGDTLANARGAVLLYCKSGTRSAFLWALARARQGADAEDLVSLAAQAGYDLRPILPWLKGAQSDF